MGLTSFISNLYLWMTVVVRSSSCKWSRLKLGFHVPAHHSTMP